MNEISCELCMDLIPLVMDGVACSSSRCAVEAHIQGCENCRLAYNGERIPEGNREKSLARVVKRVQRVSLIILAVVVLLGICLMESLMQGSSMLFLFAVWVAAALGRIAGNRKNGAFKRAAAMLLSLTVITAVAAMGNLLFGNPIAEGKAGVAAQAYLQGKFPEADYQIEDIAFDSKTGSYHAYVRSPGSLDICFEIGIRREGAIRYDSYESRVMTGWNTADRLDTAYRNQVRSILQKLNLHYKAEVSGSLDFAWIPYQGNSEMPQYLLDGKPLEPDGSYDLSELSAKIGKLSVRVELDDISAEAAADILMEVKYLMEEKGLIFSQVDLLILGSEQRDQKERNSLYLQSFPYKDIGEQDLQQKIHRLTGK